jgi:hypothetical protein
MFPGLLLQLGKIAVRVDALAFDLCDLYWARLQSESML